MWRGGSRIAVIVYSSHRWSRFKIKPEDVWPNRIFSHISINSLKIKRIKWEILDQLLLWRDWNSVLYVDLTKYKKSRHNIWSSWATIFILNWCLVSIWEAKKKYARFFEKIWLYCFTSHFIQTICNSPAELYPSGALEWT